MCHFRGRAGGREAKRPWWARPPVGSSQWGPLWAGRVCCIGRRVGGVPAAWRVRPLASPIIRQAKAGAPAGSRFRSLATRLPEALSRCRGLGRRLSDVRGRYRRRRWTARQTGDRFASTAAPRSSRRKPACPFPNRTSVFRRPPRGIPCGRERRVRLHGRAAGRAAEHWACGLPRPNHPHTRPSDGRARSVPSAGLPELQSA